MTTPQAPAQFFGLPDGSQSHVQIKVVTDATGGITRVPVALDTPQQVTEWEQIQDAARPSPSQYDAKMAVAMARPLFSADAEADAVTGGSLLDGARFAAEAIAATEVTTQTTKPRAPATQAEHDQRFAAAAQLAASLGLALVMVRADHVLGVPAHLEVRQCGNPYMAGDLPTIETVLAAMARERAGRDEQLKRWEAHRAQLAAEQAERIANLPENKIKRLEAERAEQGARIARLESMLAAQGNAV